MTDKESYEPTARGYYAQEEIMPAPSKRSSPKDSVVIADPKRELAKQQRPDASSVSQGAIIASSTLRPMPPSGSGPGKRRPNFRCQLSSRLQVASVNLPAPAHTLNALPSQAADAELQERSTSSLSNVLARRIRSRQRRRFFGPALAWSDQRMRDRSRTVDFSELQWQPRQGGGEDEDSDGDSSSYGSEVKWDEDPEAILVRHALHDQEIRT
eukprot:TRINITY_DN21449_c0_g2_i1.p1 TRINITY_DN21449_c0_g2~~TRINITY_DN21449_c0_g2_i1.p1  ORF type:complete len:212 (-),score=25.30 TRINITY_DN21449_c0_g2_i1:607-1242(-)